MAEEPSVDDTQIEQEEPKQEDTPAESGETYTSLFGASLVRACSLAFFLFLLGALFVLS